MRLGRLSKLLAPGYGWCLRCETTWPFVEHHSTDYTPTRGCFPLCEECWTDLGDPLHRLPYYEELLRRWADDVPVDIETWQQVRDAVLAGG